MTSNETKHLEVLKELNSLITKDDNFFLGRMYFTSNDESQNIFRYQPTKVMIMFSVGKREYIILN